MRYCDWDIIIFPGGSTTPIQEFQTSCHQYQHEGKFLKQIHQKYDD